MFILKKDKWTLEMIIILTPFFNTIFKDQRTMYLWNVPLICIIYTYVRANKELQKWKYGMLINDVNV